VAAAAEGGVEIRNMHWKTEAEPLLYKLPVSIYCPPPPFFTGVCIAGAGTGNGRNSFSGETVSGGVCACMP
jgi:hypothetical protein